MYDQEGIVREEAEWIVQAATEVNYLFVLLGVAWLWRPNPAAKEYAYALELSSTDAENELELTETVPSAMDDDEGENPPDLNGSFHDERFQIDDGETA